MRWRYVVPAQDYRVTSEGRIQTEQQHKHDGTPTRWLKGTQRYCPFFFFANHCKNNNPSTCCCHRMVATGTTRLTTKCSLVLVSRGKKGTAVPSIILCALPFLADAGEFESKLGWRIKWRQTPAACWRCDATLGVDRQQRQGGDTQHSCSAKHTRPV